jgi:glycosyltransferase involved in cell wall biosynthesis
MGGASEPRRICVVTETYPPEINGVALTLARLVEGLRARGHLVSVVRPRQGAVDDAARRCDPEVTLVPGAAVPGYRIVRCGWPAGALLDNRWTSRRPHVVYVATPGPLGWSAVRTARRLGLPLFSGFHTNFHGYAGPYGVGWLQRSILGYLRRFHNRTLGTFVATPDLRDQLHAAGFKNLSLLPRGVDSQLFNPERRSSALRHTWGASDGDLVALYVGRVALEKNLPLAIQAYRAMQRSTTRIRCVIVGDGPLRASLQRACPDLHFCGAQRGERLPIHYASADIFLFPSATETFGNVTLEAMASGLAVVAYDYAAARMHITNGQTGVLVPYAASRAFADAAAALAGSPQSVHAMGRQARRYAAGVDWPSVVERFETLLMKGETRCGQSKTDGWSRDSSWASSPWSWARGRPPWPSRLFGPRPSRRCSHVVCRDG